MTQPQFTYAETTPEEVAEFNEELTALGEKYNFVLAPAPFVTTEGKMDARIHVFKKVELVPKGVESPYSGNKVNDNGGNDTDKTENTDETPEAN